MGMTVYGIKRLVKNKPKSVKADGAYYGDFLSGKDAEEFCKKQEFVCWVAPYYSMG